jgi:hypothetical protein
MTTWQLLLVAVGTVLIRLLNAARRRLAGPDRYFSFSDFIDEEKYIHTHGFLLVALPPLLGGALISFLPDVHASVAVAAGFAAAFLGVWPVLQHPYQLLNENLQYYWPKLRMLYFLFIGSSAALAYLGFVSARALVPLGLSLIGTSVWHKLVEDIAANALYDILKVLLLSLLSFGGYIAFRERMKVGKAALERAYHEPRSEDGWHSDSDILRRRHHDDGYEETP